MSSADEPQSSMPGRLGRVRGPGAAERRDPSGSQRANGRQGGRAHLDPRRLRRRVRASIRHRAAPLPRSPCGRRHRRPRARQGARRWSRARRRRRARHPIRHRRVPADAPWSEPVRVLNDTCWGLTATIDDLGRYHIAAKCGDELRYVRWYPGAIDLHQDSFGAPWTGSNTARSWRPTVTTCSWPTRGTLRTRAIPVATAATSPASASSSGPGPVTRGRGRNLPVSARPGTPCNRSGRSVARCTRP